MEIPLKKSVVIGDHNQIVALINAESFSSA